MGTSGDRCCLQRRVRGDRAAEHDRRRLDAQLGSVPSNVRADQIAQPELPTGQMQLPAPICEPAGCDYPAWTSNRPDATDWPALRISQI